MSPLRYRSFWGCCGFRGSWSTFGGVGGVVLRLPCFLSCDLRVSLLSPPHFRKSLVSVWLPHKRNAHVCAEEYSLLDGNPAAHTDPAVVPVVNPPPPPTHSHTHAHSRDAWEDGFPRLTPGWGWGVLTPRLYQCSENWICADVFLHFKQNRLAQTRTFAGLWALLHPWPSSG